MNWTPWYSADDVKPELGDYIEFEASNRAGTDTILVQGMVTRSVKNEAAFYMHNLGAFAMNCICCDYEWMFWRKAILPEINPPLRKKRAQVPYSWGGLNPQELQRLQDIAKFLSKTTAGHRTAPSQPKTGGGSQK